jgi:aminoglycoside N3'-acetyltransferase
MKDGTMTRTAVTQDDIERGLADLGLRRSDAVEVHTSLSAFGWVEGGAAAVVDALMSVVGQTGTIIMSAYPVSPAIPLTEEEQARGITWKVRVLPADSTEKTGLGAVVAEFVKRPGAICGTGLHRNCAWGCDAEQHCQSYGRLQEINGWTLLMGVGIHRCSSMHWAERMPVPDEIEAHWRVPPEILADYDPAFWDVGYGGTPDDAWGKVYALADERGLIQRRRIGAAECSLFRTRAVVSLYESWRRDDPYGLFGVSPRPK